MIDVSARFGGDEFVILIGDVARPSDVTEVASRIVRALDPPIVVGNDEPWLGASVGVTIATSSAVSSESVVREADIAMYRAKARGGGGFALFDDEGRAEFERRVAAEREPREACGQLREWRASGRQVTVTVNVSTRQLNQPEFPEQVREVLAEYELPPEVLCLEVTETAIMKHISRVASSSCTPSLSGSAAIWPTRPGEPSGSPADRRPCGPGRSEPAKGRRVPLEIATGGPYEHRMLASVDGQRAGDRLAA